MKTTTLFISFLLITSLSFSQNQLLKLEDIFGNRQFVAREVSGFRTMKDGLHYTNTAVDEKNNTTNILVYEYKTGNVTDTLVKGSSLKANNDTATIDFSEYQLSDDENKIIFSTGEEQIYRHSSRANYFVFNRLIKKLTPVSEKGKQMYATLSHDGNKVAFVRDNNLFIKDFVQDRELQITFDGRKNEIINGANDWVYEEEFSFDRSFQWSPDGKRIAFYKFDETRVRQFTLTYYDSLYPREEKYKYPKAGEENSIVNIFIYDLTNGRTLKAETGAEKDQYIPRIKWTADAATLCIMRMNRHQNKLELLLCDAANGSTKVMYTEENKYYIDIDINDGMMFTADKLHFIWMKPVNGFTHICLYNINGQLEKQITSGSWDVKEFYGYDEKTKTYYYQSAEVSPMERQVYSITEKENKKLLSQPHGTNDADFSGNFKYFINTWSDANTPYLVTLNSNDGRQIRTLEENKSVKESMSKYLLTKKEFFKFKTTEGIELNGWMIKPSGFDANKKYPVFQYMYGGPGAQTVWDMWERSNYFYWQMLAQKGYIVVCVDNRGTGARGEEFQKCTYKNLGHLEVVDQIETAKYLGSLPYVDKNRIGVFGWSYGGYMTSLLMTKGADYFKAGIAVAPVTNWRYYDTIYTERYLLTPQENAAGYDDNSPVNFAKMLKGKFLLVHGIADDNVHVQNSMDFVTALVKEKKQFETFFYPDKNHGLPGARLHLYNKMTDFILENL